MLRSDYKKSRLNIFLEPRLRQQLDCLSAESGTSVTCLVETFLTERIRQEMHTSNSTTKDEQ